MQALFVHGMGRTPLSGFSLLRRLRQRGISTHGFFYSVTFQSFTGISQRLQRKIAIVAARGEYVLIGHSLGGVLIRDAVAGLPPEVRRPQRIFLLGSPIRPSRMAQRIHRNWLFRLMTRDCGQLLASKSRMEQVARCEVPTTSIVGTCRILVLSRLFGEEENDGVVSHSEITADWITEEIRVRVTHTFIPSNRRVTELVVERIVELIGE